VKEREVITVVSGLPRSGTSMMMKMLEAGGMPVLTDRERVADTDNPRGYYEFERVKKLPQGEVGWLDEAAGRAVKIVSALLRWLPDGRPYRVVFMDRDLDEVLASQRRMLENRIGGHDGAEDDRLRETFRRHLADVDHWFEGRQDLRVHHVKHRQLLNDPERELRPVVDFLGGNLDLQRMAAVVDPTLYRQRRAGA
jgi:hypothetical protein